MHKHRKSRSNKVSEYVRPFFGQVAWPGNPRAHGGITTTEVCSCGAKRAINCNMGHIERGEWE